MDVTPVKNPRKTKSRDDSIRSMTLLSHLGKVMEMIIREELQTFLESHKKLAEQ